MNEFYIFVAGFIFGLVAIHVYFFLRDFIIAIKDSKK